MDPRVTTRTPLRVALLGLGSVGRPVARALADDAWRQAMEARGSCPPVLAAVGVRDPGRARGVTLPDTVRVTDDCEALVADPGIDVVVELLGGLDPAHGLVRAALESGRPVVTGNKALLASHGPELEALARDRGVALRFEAAVGGGMPILGPIATDLAANEIRAIRGIINGTTNHILSAMARDGRTYPDVLDEAIARGYAEADPSGDVEGYDAAHKLAILARLGFGTWLDPRTIRRSSPASVRDAGTGRDPGMARDAAPGITAVTREDMGGAARLGLTLKLVARAERTDDGSLRAAVGPMAVRSSSALGSTDGVLNLVEIVGDPVGRVAFRGPGAGGPATSSAVLGDLLAISRGAGATWGTLPPATVAVDAADDLAGAGGWYLAASQLGYGPLSGRIADVMLAQDMDAIVVRPMPLDALQARLEELDIATRIYPVLAEA